MNIIYLKVNFIVATLPQNIYRYISVFFYLMNYEIDLNTIFIPHATSCGGYNVFDPSVSQSSFSCQRNSSETAQQNSWNFVIMKDILCRYAFPQEILIFFLGVMPFLNLEIWHKWKILLKQFVSATPLKPLNSSYDSEGHNV